MKIRVWVGKSRIAGKGLFTAQNINPTTTSIVDITTITHNTLLLLGQCYAPAQAYFYTGMGYRTLRDESQALACFTTP